MRNKHFEYSGQIYYNPPDKSYLELGLNKVGGSEYKISVGQASNIDGLRSETTKKFMNRLGTNNKDKLNTESKYLSELDKHSEIMPRSYQNNMGDFSSIKERTNEDDEDAQVKKAIGKLLLSTLKLHNVHSSSILHRAQHKRSRRS